jgi:hypothetical protein
VKEIGVSSIYEKPQIQQGPNPEEVYIVINIFIKQSITKPHIKRGDYS